MNFLATDLDGTFIPNSSKTELIEALEYFHKIKKDSDDFKLIFVTGRNFKQVEDGIKEYNLPEPDFIISDVGTTIYNRSLNGWVLNDEYYKNLSRILNNINRENLINWLIQKAGVSLQEDYRQGDFKISFYLEPKNSITIIDDLNIKIKKENLPYDVIFSQDPITKKGLLDILPKGVSKVYALKWVLKNYSASGDSVAFAGDSGNDLDLFISGINSIIVKNTPENIKVKANSWALENGKTKTLFFATKESTAGVLQGCRHFNII